MIARVALLDPEGGRPDLGTVLAGDRPVQVVRCASVDELSAEKADLGIIVCSLERLPAMLEAVGATEFRQPVVVLAARQDDDHPLLWLMRALVKAKADWQAVFDSLTDPVALLDPRGVIRRANLDFARMVGRPIREALGENVREVLGSALDARPDDPIATALADQRAHSGEVSYSSLDCVHLVSISPLSSDDGSGFVLLMKDISEHKQRQQTLMRSARLADVGQLAAGIAHEINTPLASVALRAESLLRSAEDVTLRDLPAFRNFPRYLRTIEAEVDRCKRIVRALLEFSSQQEPEMRAVDLNQLVEGAAELVGHELRLRQVRLERHLHPDSPTAPADAGQLRQVLVALLMNALEASSPGGSIRVTTSRDGSGQVALAVEDDGRGIPTELQDKVWSPFFSTKPFGERTGMGLAICHGIVKAHGGSVDLESSPGRGTRVRVRIPETSRRDR